MKATLLLKTVSALSAIWITASHAAEDQLSQGRLYGLTLDKVANVPAITSALGSFAKIPTARIVFDENEPPSYYAKPIAQIGNVAYIMGELLDSQYVSTYSVSAYSQRVASYLKTLGPIGQVDLWEIGNEVNGEWLGSTPDVVAKIHDAYRQVKAYGYRTALTLYYNGPADDGSNSCWADIDHAMFPWAQTNVPTDMKADLDYVLVSYYEQDCKGIKPDWTSVFSQLHVMFPNSAIGFGETGAPRRWTSAQKSAYIRRYYDYDKIITVPNFVGGQFWWYAYEDVVPKTKPLWTTMNATFEAN